MDFATRDRYRHVVEEIAQAQRRSPKARSRARRSCSSRRAAAAATPADDARGARRLLPDRQRAAAARARGRGCAVTAAAKRCAGSARRVAAAAVPRRDRASLTALFAASAARATRAPTASHGCVARAVRRARRARRQPARGGAGELAGDAARRRRSRCRGWTSPTGIPPQSRTLVVVPTMLDRAPQDIDDLVEALEVRFLANRDDHLHFAPADRLSSTRRARPLPADEAAARRCARRRIEELNAKYARGPRRRLLPVPPAAPLERRASGSGWATSASAASSRS